MPASERAPNSGYRCRGRSWESAAPAVDRPPCPRDNTGSTQSILRADQHGIRAGRKTAERPMFAKLKAVWARLAGAHGASEVERDAAPAVEYKGYRIRPTPFRSNGHYQTAGIIEKDAPDGVKAHRFIRADTHQSKEDAVAFVISKAKQIIDLQGDRIFMAPNEG
jgi:hypothetical protein